MPTENRRVVKKNNEIKSRLNVVFRDKLKVRVTGQFFTELIHEEFTLILNACLT